MRPIPPRLATVGVIADELNESVARICRLLRARPHIQPSAYAGNTRLFDSASVAEIERELVAMNRRQSVRKGGQHAK